MRPSEINVQYRGGYRGPYIDIRTLIEKRVKLTVIDFQERKVVKVPVADYVSAANATTPTNEECTECLHGAGYDSEQIAVILRGGTL